MPEHKIIIDVEIAAPPERVFDAWTDPTQLATPESSEHTNETTTTSPVA